MNENRALLAVVLWLVACLVACGTPERFQSPMPEPRTRAFRECKVDADCAYTHNGCCDCINGGADIAVRRDQLDAFRAQFACAGHPCTEMGGDCGAGTVACDQGMCVYRAP